MTTRTLMFPPTHTADRYGLLLEGGDLSVDRLICAYQQGIFPWYSSPPIQWWAPPLRAVFITPLHVSRSMRKLIRQRFCCLPDKNTLTQRPIRWVMTTNLTFEQVMHECAKREDGDTWIVSDMISAYSAMHARGLAYSFELWEFTTYPEEDFHPDIPPTMDMIEKAGGRLIGGLYGVGLGKMFFGESMFSRRPNASKALLSILCHWMTVHDMPLLDAQIPNPHTQSLGAVLIAREDFEYLLTGLIREPAPCFPAVFSVDRDFLEK